MDKFDAGPDLQSVSPRSFTIENAILTSNDGNPVEIKSLIQDVKIHESLNMSNLIAEVYVVDAANLFFHMKLSGNEKLELVIFRIEPGNVFKEYPRKPPKLHQTPAKTSQKFFQKHYRKLPQIL